MNLKVISVDEGTPSVSPDYRLFRVDVMIDDVWCEEEAGLRRWVTHTFATPPQQVDYWTEGGGKGSLTFIAYGIPASSPEHARELVAGLHPLDHVTV